eukprot:GHUV01009876.1.p1 GENE.GHUV01009876.1~~GHUV01009876.1.p1  ORF type:complete len:458 (+),score=141.47 GHUV01009876.1:373-1746(+)
MSRLLLQLRTTPPQTAAVLSTLHRLPNIQQPAAIRASSQAHYQPSLGRALGTKPHSNWSQLVCSTARSYYTTSCQALQQKQGKPASARGCRSATDPLHMVHDASDNTSYDTLDLLEAPAGHNAAAVVCTVPARTAAQQGKPLAQQDRDLAASRKDATMSAGVSPAKRRRTQWDWECPACSNKFNAGVRLLQHMNKCCPDLVIRQQQQQLAQQQQPTHTLQEQTASGLITLAGHPPPAVAAVDDVGDTAVRQLLAVAAEREQALRMRVLQLQFVADPGGGVPPVAAASPSTVAAANTSMEGQLQTADNPDEGAADESEDLDSTLLTRVQPHASFRLNGTATGVSVSLQHQSDEKGAVQQKSNRWKSERQPLRSPQQIADILRLPMPRYESAMGSIQTQQRVGPIWHAAGASCVYSPPCHLRVEWGMVGWAREWWEGGRWHASMLVLCCSEVRAAPSNS